LIRRLWLLNSVLAVALFLLGHALWSRWEDEQARKNEVANRKIVSDPVQSTPPRPVVPKLEPNAYIDVAKKVLFAKDRSPDVIPEPPPPPPPEPKPPAFPVAHGVMIWGDVPPTIILSTDSKGEQRSYQAGDKVGEFEIASLDDRQIVLTWDGKTFVKNISDLEAAATPPPAERRTAANREPAAAGAAPPVQQVTNISQQAGPGGGRNVTPDGRTKSCDRNDPNPVGTIVDGYRKVAVVNPLAPNAHFCQWQAVN